MTKFIRHNYPYLFIIIISLGISISTLLFQSIRLDEAQSLWVSVKSINQILYLDAQDVLVPLYELLLHFWIQLFGNSIVAARLLSFTFYLLTLPFLYILCKEASNKRVAIITVTLFSLSPFIMWYSSEARMYTLFTFVTTLNHLFFVRYQQSHGRSSKFGYVVTGALGLYTHYFFIFLLITQCMYLLALYVFKKDTISKVLFWKYVLLLTTIGIFFTPWAIYFLQLGGAANTQPFIPPPTSFNLFQAFVNFIFGFQGNAIQSVLISLWPIFTLSLFLVFTRNEKQENDSINYFSFATFFPIALVFIGSLIRPIFLTRYLILVTPTLFFLIAWMISGYKKSTSRLVLGVLLCGMFILMVYQNISTSTPVKENYEGVAKFLEKNATPSDIIAVSAPFTIYPIEYEYEGNTQIVTIPEWDRDKQGAIPPFSVQNFEKQIASYKKQYVHIFVVLSYNQGYQNTLVHYLDMHYYRNNLQEFSSGLEVREYQLRYDTLSHTAQ